MMNDRATAGNVRCVNHPSSFPGSSALVIGDDSGALYCFGAKQEESVP
jgi:hypothetical protein